MSNAPSEPNIEPSRQLVPAPNDPTAAERQRTLLCARQDEIQIEFDDDGNASLIQKNWPDGDSLIHVSRDNLQTFLDGICDAFGVPTFGGSR